VPDHVQDHSTAPTGRLSGWRTILLGVVAFAAAFWLLRETMSIAMPLVTALLLALGVWPMVAGISRHMPRGLKWLGPTAGLLLVLALVVVFFAALGLAIGQVYDLLGNIGPTLERWLGSFGLPGLTWAELQEEGNGSMVSTARTALGLTAHTLTGVVLILFLMLLMLVEVETWHRKFITISARRSDRDLREMGRSVGEKFRVYFWTRLVLALLSAALYVAWLWYFDVEYLLLWGLITVLLGFIPTVGSIISGMLPALYALLTKDPGTALLIAAGLLVIEQVVGNLIDPVVLGRKVAVSPLVVLVALGFWTILWGIPGAILAVPLTVLIILAMAHFEALRPAALLLTDRSSFEELEEFRHPEE
jgi:AI-2 transport protein TqsA